MGRRGHSPGLCGTPGSSEARTVVPVTGVPRSSRHRPRWPERLRQRSTAVSVPAPTREASRGYAFDGQMCLDRQPDLSCDRPLGFPGALLKLLERLGVEAKLDVLLLGHGPPCTTDGHAIARRTSRRSRSSGLERWNPRPRMLPLMDMRLPHLMRDS